MNVNLKRTVKAMMVTSLVLALPTIPLANTATDRALFEMNARSAGQPGEQMIRPGYALIDDAAARIVPVPYRIQIDESVPASMQIVWSGGDNWMEVLRRALAPAGLVAEADWSRNTIKIAWKSRPSQVIAQSAREAPVAGAPAAPASAFEVVSPAQTGGFVVVQKQSNDGGFVVTKPAPVYDAPAAPAVQRQFQDRDAGRSERYAVSASADLPSSAVMWRLMQAAVNGEKIVLSGVSSLGSEEQRARYGAMYAKRLRSRLVEIGFPADTVVLGSRQSDRANKAGVRIMVSKEEA